MANNDKSKKSNKIIAAAIIGSLSGAVLGLLLATKSGQELRQDINEQAQKLRDKAVEIKDKTQSAWHNIEDKTEKTVANSKSCIQKGKLLVSNLKTLAYEIRHGALTKTLYLDTGDGDTVNPTKEI
ncbi:YtxH domain-containing protein [Desulfosporosinus fructosivorans]